MKESPENSKKNMDVKPLLEINGTSEENENEDYEIGSEFRDIDFRALQDAIDSAGDLEEVEKEALKSEIFRQKKEAFAKKQEILKAEHERQKDILRGMKLKKSKPEEIKEQTNVCKQAYDRWHKFTLDKSLEVPHELYELLEKDLLTRPQRIWLLHFCFNGGNPIDSCSKANVSIRQYRKWMLADNERDKQFVEAKDDVNLAYTDIAEMTLKEMAASKNSAAVIFFLRNRHEDYKDAKKMVEDRKKNQYNKLTDYSKVDTADKKADFLDKVGVKDE